MTEIPPLVSVVMPVYNGMPFLPDAVSSILQQTLRDFELLIVDDGSTDSSREWIKAQTDPRIRLITLSENKGVTGALQEGLRAAKGVYVARLDADDQALPNRLEAQVKYLNNHQEVGLLGSGIQLMDQSGKSLPHRNKKRNDIDLRWTLLFKNPVIHSSVMFRRSVVTRANLEYRLRHAEDYQLWIDILKISRGFISADPLIRYRIHEQSWTFTKKQEQDDAKNKIIARQLAPYLGDEAPLPEFIAWVRGGTTPAKLIPGFISLYLKLLAGFFKTAGRGHARFFVKRIAWLRKRSSWQQRIRMDILVFYLRARWS